MSAASCLRSRRSYLGLILGALLMPASCLPDRTSSSFLSPLDRIGNVKGRAQKPDVLAAKDTEEAGKALKAYFDQVGRKGLPNLLDDPDTSLALHAAWEYYIGPGTKKAPPRPKDFLTFFERRTGVKAPLRWEYAIVERGLSISPEWYELESAAKREYLPRCDFLSKREGFPDHDIGYSPQTMAETELRLSAPIGTAIKRSDGKIIIQNDQGKLVVADADIPENVRRDCNRIAVNIGSRRSFVTFSDQFVANGFELICFDSCSSQRLWEREGSATGTHLTILGPHHADVLLVATETQIVVFGIGTLGDFVEVFEADSGAPVFRFTDDWLPFGSFDPARWRRHL